MHWWQGKTRAQDKTFFWGGHWESDSICSSGDRSGLTWTSFVIKGRIVDRERVRSVCFGNQDQARTSQLLRTKVEFKRFFEDSNYGWAELLILENSCLHNSSCQKWSLPSNLYVHCFSSCWPYIFPPYILTAFVPDAYLHCLHVSRLFYDNCANCVGS